MKIKVLLIVLMVCGFGLSLASADSITWWRFEEGSAGDVVSTVQDWAPDGISEGSLSGGDPSGDPVYTLTGHSLDVNGLADSVAIQMDGFDDYIPNIPFITLTAESTFTMECILNWAGPMETHAEGFRATDMILQQGDGIGTGRSLLYVSTTSEVDETETPIFASYLGGVTTNIPDVEFPSNQWIYVGLTYDDGILTLWMDTDLSDGIQPDSNIGENFVDFEDNDAPLILGRHKSMIDYFHGQISEFRITDSGLGADGMSPPADHLQVSLKVGVQEWSLY